MRRLFIAIDISDEARSMAAKYIHDLRQQFPHLRVGWERTEKLHLTLKFLGDVGENRFVEIHDAVNKIARSHGSFSAEIAGTGVFPYLRNPRILWLGMVEDCGVLAEIARNIESDCEELRFPAAKRAFSSHITVARLREPQRSRELAEKHLANEFEPVEFEVSEIVIYESRLRPTGSIYRKISSFELRS